MSDFDWKGAIRAVAPGIATAIGKPAAGMAITVLSNAILGRPDGSEDEIASAVAQGLNGDQIVALKKAGLDFDLEMAKIAQASEVAALADVANARQQTVALASSGSSIAWGAPVVSIIVLAGYFMCICLLFLRGEDMPPNVFNLVNVLFGALSLAFGGVVNYWMGSSAGSKRAGDAVREIAVNQSKRP